MAITAAELKCYQALSMPEDDIGPSGGGINTAGVLDLSPLAANDTIGIISDGADTRTVTLTGRDASGAIVSEALVLTGAVRVAGVQVFERILKIVLSAADAARSVTIDRNTGGALVATLVPNITSTRRLFYDCTSEVAATTRYEKKFCQNEHGSLTLNNATLRLSADPSAKILIGTDTAKGSTASVPNRKATPAGVTFVDDNIDAGIPGGILAAGENIGVWIRLDLLASDAALKTSLSTTLNGTSV